MYYNTINRTLEFLTERREFKMKFFKRLTAALTLPVLFACFFGCAAGAEAQYSDVTADDWFFENVTEMSGRGVLSGYPDGSFRPNDEITAAEFVTVAANEAGLAEADAQNAHWASGLLCAALERGWYDWDEIPPTAETYDEPITRQLAVKIVMNAYLPDAKGDYSTETAKIADFSDVDGRYYNAVIAAYASGVAGGDENGRFNPKASLTRAEACALISRASQKSDLTGGEAASENASPAPSAAAQEETASSKTATQGGISENGRLRVVGTELCNENGETVVLRGMSSHGIQWFGEFLSEAAIKSTAERGANLFRIAMYTSENGYIQNPNLKQTLTNAVDTALSLDMYAIVDWHILSDGNPNTYIDEAKAFFAEIAERYKDSGGVLYEICNEPNGSVTWSGDVKPYAEEIIGTIRAVDPDAVILVGSPTWSQDLHEVAKDPLDAENIMYTCHFYAGTHTDWLRNRISDALAQGLPVFVSEWGTSDASGSGGVYLEEAQRWLDFLNENNISWANWSLCDKNESSAAVTQGADISDGIADDELTDSGRFVFSHFSD